MAHRDLMLEVPKTDIPMVLCNGDSSSASLRHSANHLHLVNSYRQMTDPCLCNDGNGSLKVPGFSDVPLDLEIYPQNRFTHGATEWAQWSNLTARELAMLGLMNDLTEEHGWHKSIFDDNLMSDWRMQALSRPLISPKAWDWCLAELQDKALYFEQTGNIVVFNTGAGIVKSDAVAEMIQTELRDAAKLLEADEKAPRQQVVLNLVDPSLFPLVYGRTRVLMDSGRILIKQNRGRTPIRIRTYGVEPDNERPKWATWDNLRKLESDRSNTAFKEAVDEIKEYLALPEKLEGREGDQISPTWETENGGCRKHSTQSGKD
ncbi:unnamed protein product [Aureobasidium pullulans]|nr:unnamed protein product [Aureobasidium pullulans]